MPFSPGAAGTSIPGWHEWRPYSRRPLVRGRGYGVELARLMLHEIRWRAGPRQWGLRITTCFLVLLLHVVALTMMALVRPPGSGAGQGNGGTATVAVRLIDEPAAAPAPPPIAMPVRPAAPTVPATPAAKPAPTAALPPVSVPRPPPPKIVPMPAKPVVTLALPVVPRAPAQVSPQAVEAPPIVVAPLRIVAEPSPMAIPVPPSQRVDVLPVPDIVPTLAPVPVEEQAPRITARAPPLAAAVPPPVAVQPVVPARVEATPLPDVPTVAPPPTVAVPLPVAPIAQVSRSMPSIPVQAPTVTVTAVSPSTAQAPQPTASRTAQVAPASSAPWTLGNDQFKPASGRASAAANPVREGNGTVQLVPRGNSDVMTRSTDHLGYKATIFEQDWAPSNESILDTFLRRFIEKLTVKHTFNVAPGIRVHCVLGPIALFLTCGGDPPRPRPAKSGDVRLNMAPARPLVPGLHPPAAPHPAGAPVLHLDNAAQCETARIAGSPPPPGCPGAPAAASSVLH